MDANQYANKEEARFEMYALQHCGYERQTTFYSDLSLAETCGAKQVKEAYKKIVKAWSTNIFYFTEFVLCLRFKTLEFCDMDNRSPRFASLYNNLYCKAKKIAYNNFNQSGVEYFRNIIG